MKPPLTTEARPTPKTDEYAMSDMIMSDARFRYVTRWIHFAQELERSNQVLTEALEEAQAWKKSQLAVTDWWAEVDAFVRCHPKSFVGDSVSGNALMLLRSGDAFEHALLDIASVDQGRPAMQVANDCTRIARKALQRPTP